MSTSNEAIGCVRTALADEINDVLQAALNSAGHAAALNFKSLTVVPARNNAVDYKHPSTKKVLVALDIQPERLQRISYRSKWGGYKIRDDRLMPSHFTYTVYAPAGYVASVIKGAYFQASATEKLSYVTEIKDYDPPSKGKRIRLRAAHDENLKRHITIKRNGARKVKLYHRENGHPDFYKDDGYNPRTISCDGFVYRSLPAVSTNGKAHHTNGVAKEAFDPDQKITRTGQAEIRKGRIRRERAFKPVVLADKYHTQPSTGQFSLRSRALKDRINHADDTYTVLQFTGKMYAATHYSEKGGRISLTSYNSEGEALKNLGGDTRASVQRKLRRSPPPDKIKKSALLWKAASIDQTLNSIFDSLPEEVAAPTAMSVDNYEIPPCPEPKAPIAEITASRLPGSRQALAQSAP